MDNYHFQTLVSYNLFFAIGILEVGPQYISSFGLNTENQR